MPTDVTNLVVGPKAIDAYSRLSYTMWFALAEFVDNSTQSKENYDSVIDEVLKQEGSPLTVSIVHHRQLKEIHIEDNSIGMDKNDLVNALKIANPTGDSKGRSKYGMGMKTAACWIGRRWQVVTCEWGSGEEWTADVDVDAIAKGDNRVPLTMRNVDSDSHYTKIIIKDLRRVIQGRSERTIKEYLGSMYMFDLRPADKSKPPLKLTYNGEEIKPPDLSEWDVDKSNQMVKKDLPPFKIGDKKISGWVGVLKKGGRKLAGFSLYQNERQIQGYPNAWKPRSIFGGVDGEGANNLIAQRLAGVLLLDGFVVSHTKDTVLFEDEEEEILEKYLLEQTKDYVEYAKSRRGKNPLTNKWGKDQIRSLVDDLKDEFMSDEIKDALNQAILPPEQTQEASQAKQRDALTEDDEVARFTILPDLTVVMSVTEVSEYEPYVQFVPAASPGVLHVIINGLHPYYQTIESKDAIEECLQQYVFDAVSEFKVSQMTARVNPNSVKLIKDRLLIAACARADNSGEESRQEATDSLLDNHN